MTASAKPALPAIVALRRSLLTSTAVDAIAIGAGMIDLARQWVRAVPVEPENTETSP